MTTKQMRELDAWIAENVMGNPQRRVRVTDGKKLVRYEFLKVGTNGICPDYTTDPAAAMEVLKMCCAKYSTLIDGNRKPDFKFRCITWDDLIEGEYAETIELAICQFAKKLFA